MLGILFWDLASVQWHVDQRDAVGLTEVHGQVLLPGHQRLVAFFTLVQIATTEDATEDEAEAEEDLEELLFGLDELIDEVERVAQS